MDKQYKPVSALYFFRFFKPYRGFIFLTAFFLIANTVANTLEPLYLRNIIDGLTLSQSAKVILGFLMIYFIIKFLGVIFEYLRDYIWAPVIVKVTRDIEEAVFAHLLRLSMDYHADQKSGSAVRALVRGSNAVGIILDFTVSRIIPPFFELIFVTILLLRLYTWQFGIITLGTIILYTWFILWSNERRIKYRVEGNLKDDAASGVLVDTIGNIETVKYFNNSMILFNLWGSIKKEWIYLLTRNNRLFSLGYAAQSLILLVGLGIILTLAVNQAISGIITIGGLVLVSTYIIRLSGPISVLGFVYGQYKNSFADLQAMAGILNQEVHIPEPENPMPIKDPQGEVVFNKIDFAYKGREKIMDNLTFSVKPGQKVAFVGPSGAGKSTIAKLIFRLYDVDKGEILIDGVNIKDLSAETRRQILSIVPQEPTLFNDSIANNIKFGKSDATKEEMITAAKAAHIHEFIDSLPQKYDTLVGERGIKISGGQKQRVAIARAVIKNPKILVFDEATSSLDTKSEQAILKTLDEVAEGRTTIAIAHRLSTIVNSDVIYVLQKGRVEEQGTHQELLKKKGLYAHMWELQSKTHEDNKEEKVPEEALMPEIAHVS
jgi:ABC-type transport system involved in Fe-S cluster assembly fused permease/ATPase subunit